LQNLPTPCSGCVNEPPEYDPRNLLFELEFTKVYSARDSWGSFNWPVYLRLLEGEGLTEQEIVDCIEKAVVVERMIMEAWSAKEKVKKNA